MTRRLVTSLAVVALATVALAGCAATPELETSVASDLQSLVATVAEESAGGDTAAALDDLDTLQDTLDAAESAGDVSDARSTEIQEAIDLVRADLDSIVAADAAAEAQRVEDERLAAEKEAAAKEAADQAAADKLAAEQQAAEDAKNSGPGNANENKNKKPGKDKKG